MSNKGKGNLIFITSGFPIKDVSEPYINGEVNYLSNCFDNILIVPLTLSGCAEINPLPLNVTLLRAQRKIGFKKSNQWLMVLLLQELKNILSLNKPLQKLRQYRAYLKDKFNLYYGLVTDETFQKYLSSEKVTVYSYWLSEPALIGSFVKKEYPEVKFVSRAHGYDVFEEQSEYNYIPFKKFKLSLLDIVFSVSKLGADHLKNPFQNYAHKVKVSYLGTGNPGLTASIEESSFSIVTCSIVRDVKRLYLMPEILKNIDFELTWHILGDGTSMENLKYLNSQLPKNITIVYHGLLKNDEIFEFYKNNSVNLFVSLSSSEGLPVSMMEAQSFGIPILSTNVGGCSEICNKSTGILIERDFVPSMVAQKIKEFRSSEMNTNEFREKCRKYWENNFKAEVNYKKFAEDISA